MLILAIDTSGHAVSVALLDGDRLLGETALDRGRRAAQTLAPAIVRLLAQHSIASAQIRLVATTIGPGSFTGLRIGVTTAKTFAYAIGAEVLGVSTLEAIAHQVPPELLAEPAHEIHAILDAQRQELYLGRFGTESGGNPHDDLPGLTRLDPDRIIVARTWSNSISPGTVVTGTGVDWLSDQLPPSALIVPPRLRDVQAATVGRLAWRDYDRGRREDLWKLAPIYLRPSYAEEKAASGRR